MSVVLALTSVGCDGSDIDSDSTADTSDADAADGENDGEKDDDGGATPAEDDGSDDDSQADEDTETSDSAGDEDEDSESTSGDDGDDEGDEDETTETSGTGEDDSETTDTGESSGETDDPADEIPDNEYCRPVADWDEFWAQLERDVVAEVNIRRMSKQSCGAKGDFDPAGPLTMEASLHCAARAHSKDMVDRDFFSHTNPDNEDPTSRIQKAGFRGGATGENIAYGNATAAGVVQQWMDSDGHCANIMSPNFTQIGMGYDRGSGMPHMWTQTFGG